MAGERELVPEPLGQRVLAYRTVLALSLCYLVWGAVDQYSDSHNHVDFKQYYLGAWTVRAGLCDSLYPDPMPGAVYNAGVYSTLKPTQRELADRVGTKGERPYFVQPPPAAVLLAPLAWLDYTTADRLWAWVSALAAWGAAVLGGRILRVLSQADSPTVLEIVAVLFAVLRPQTLLELSVGNVSPVVGLAIACGIYGLATGRPVLAAVGIGLAAVLKVTPLVLVPLFCARFRLRTAAVTCAGGVAAVLATVAVTGTRPWREYLTRISPTLARPWLPTGDGSEPEQMTHSIHAVAWWAVRQNPLPQTVSAGIQATGLAVLCVLLGLIGRHRYRGRIGSEVVVPAAFALTAWSLIFAPIFWPHYSYYYTFGTGWLLTHLRFGPARAILAGAALMLMYLPPRRLEFDNTDSFAYFLVPLLTVGLMGACGVLDLFAARRLLARALSRP